MHDVNRAVPRERPDFHRASCETINGICRKRIHLVGLGEPQRTRIVVGLGVAASQYRSGILRPHRTIAGDVRVRRDRRARPEVVGEPVDDALGQVVGAAHEHIVDRRAVGLTGLHAAWGKCDAAPGSAAVEKQQALVLDDIAHGVEVEAIARHDNVRRVDGPDPRQLVHGRGDSRRDLTPV